jgi:processive rubber oxygenase RoxA-like protein
MKLFAAALLLITAATALSAEKSPAQRGRDALLGQAFAPPITPRHAYDRLWRAWGAKEKPADFDRQLRQRYGLHEPNYPNHGLPMGLRENKGLFGKGVTNDCMLCHAGSIAGKTIIGLGNSTLDLQGLFDDLATAQGIKNGFPIAFSQVRGTVEASAATVYLLQFRKPDLTLREPITMKIPDSTCEDVPAWWLMKRKTTMYATGSHSARSVRSLMAFMLSPLNSGETIKQEEPTFREIQAYLLSLEAPKYPFPIDDKKAETGKAIFEKTCARCHGTYGPDGKYPNKVIDLDIIGTDPSLTRDFPDEVADLYNKSWFGQELYAHGKQIPAKVTRGYQAPPLDGIWATAPYFHNASAPTVYHVLNSKARPKIFTRSYTTAADDYDQEKLGLKFTAVKGPPNPRLPAPERRKIYDTTQHGRANTGHTFGDKLSEDERLAIIEYLKTL